ncbi:inositol transport system substrate-binding protein [Pseudobutyrivibrio sp. ACV-2]|uniref:sugar ABC transporter substrate-binding protein n=1 Tax=Pseudobutyrivibrio sp. ACV-2 TaxID=1520801 RepID=UPI000896E5F3|nr:sugar ABC transporter substrate-binding protein [Pseudobutyrivibrio sp. ACV-2]SEA71047.1 inositol transport system substrate-binding protein [Pseudobutyrivibrio sp. ACV-2]
MRINIRLKKLVGFMLVVVMTSAMMLAGCGSSNSGASTGNAGGIKILYSGPPSDTFKQLLMDGLQEAAAEEGLTLDIGAPCESVNDQVEQIRDAVSSGYNAIVCLPVDRATALQLEVVAGDLPIIYVNGVPDEQFLKANKYMAVSSYEYTAGEYQAEYVWNKLGKPSSINAVILRGELTHNAAIQRSLSVKNWLRENGVDVNIVFDDTANWSVEEAEYVFNVFLQTGQSFDAVFCNNDDMALGVVEAMKAAGYDLNKIPVVGVDATTAGCESIAKGEMQFTVYQSAVGQAQMAAQVVKQVVKNGKVEGLDGLSEDGLYVWVPFEPVDASNVKDYM